MDEVFDVAIIGGGINGCGCAADASLRGLSVVLLEQDDIASKTSSSSTKLIHGGLRYLEHWEFGLVRKALKERQTLLQVAPHIVYPQAFVLPYLKSMRPAWLLRLGLFIYDHLSLSNPLTKSQAISRTHQPELFKPLKDAIQKGFMYYDGATDDARLTLFNALQAANHKAQIRTRNKVIQLNRLNDLWEITVKPQNGAPYLVKAKSLINAAGPWVDSVAGMAQSNSTTKISLVKGSHIVVPRLFEGSHAYFMQHTDDRVIFAIPYQNDTLIGTTDVAYQGSLEDVHISDEEVAYLLAITNNYFNKNLQPKDLIHSWSGLRPLVAEDAKNPSTMSRDYTIVASKTKAPLISIYGGKITTYRQLSAEAVDALKLLFPDLSTTKTAAIPLPGASYGTLDFEAYQDHATTHFSWIAKNQLERYLKTYGSCMEQFLQGCSSYKDLGINFGADLYQVEVDYLISKEWAQTVDDILYRRTKLGYQIKDPSRLKEYLDQ